MAPVTSTAARIEATRAIGRRNTESPVVKTAAKTAAGLGDRNLHFHDLRGTAATRFYTAGLSERVIAEILGWEEEQVSRIIRRYVGRSAATKAIIRQLNKPGTRT